MDVSAEPRGSDESDSSSTPRSKRNGLHELYVQSMPDAVALAFLLTGDEAAAGRIADRAFVRATARFTHRLARHRLPASLRRHVVALFLRRERRNGRDQNEPDPVDRRAGPDGTWWALSSLPARERAAVVLRYCRGLGEEDVARALGCSLPAARLAVSRGTDLLEAASGQELGGGPERA
jgi:DNA-directed RNA polymerase specialized sigma24 family protein